MLRLSRLLVGPLEMPQRLRAGLPDAAVFVLLRFERVVTFRLNVRQFQFLSQHLGQLFDGDLDIASVSAPRLAAGLAFAVFLIAAAANRLPDFPFTLSDTAGTLLPVAEVRDVNVRHRDRHQPPPLPSGHLTVSDVPAQVFADSSFDDLFEPLHVSVDSSCHVISPFSRSQTQTCS